MNWLNMIQAARLKTLPAAVVPVWLGTVLVWLLGYSVDLRILLATLGGALFIQIATNLFNDALDAEKGADTPMRLGPQRVTASGLMSSKQVKSIALILLGLATLCGLYLFSQRSWMVVWIGLPSMLLAYAYTGGPFPLAYKGLGEIFVILFFGIIAVSGTVFMQLGFFPTESMILGLQVGLLSAVLISINNLRDVDEDKGSGKKTLAVRFGKTFGFFLIWMELKLAAFLGIYWVVVGREAFALASLPILIMGFKILWTLLKVNEVATWARVLGMSSLLLIGFGVAFHLIAYLQMNI